MRAPRFSLAALGLIFALAGCGTYRLGTGTEQQFRSLYIAPVKNAAAMPQATALYSKELREAFIRDGRVLVAGSADEADAVLEITLEDYKREATSALPEDTRLARKFDLVLSAHATLTDNRTHRDYFRNRELEFSRQIFTTSQPKGEISRQQQAEYNAQPLLARKLAEDTLHVVLDTW